MLTFNNSAGGDDMLTSKEAAALCGYSTDYIGQLCREGRVQCTRLKKGWLVSRQSLVKHFETKNPGGVPSENIVTDPKMPAGEPAPAVSAHQAHPVKIKIPEPPKINKDRPIVKVPMVQEHFSGRKLARIHRALKEGSLKASNVLADSLNTYPTRDFLHKALSLITAVLIVLTPYYMYEAGVLSSFGDSMFDKTDQTASFVSGLSNGDLGGSAAFVLSDARLVMMDMEMVLLDLGQWSQEEIKYAARLVAIAVNELVSNPAAFTYTAMYNWGAGIGFICEKTASGVVLAADRLGELLVAAVIGK